jgi:hypothetical protein
VLSFTWWSVLVYVFDAMLMLAHQEEPVVEPWQDLGHVQLSDDGESHSYVIKVKVTPYWTCE